MNWLDLGPLSAQDLFRELGLKVQAQKPGKPGAENRWYWKNIQIQTAVADEAACSQVS